MYGVPGILRNSCGIQRDFRRTHRSKITEGLARNFFVDKGVHFWYVLIQNIEYDVRWPVMDKTTVEIGSRTMTLEGKAKCAHHPDGQLCQWGRCGVVCPTCPASSCGLDEGHAGNHRCSNCGNSF